MLLTSMYVLLFLVWAHMCLRGRTDATPAVADSQPADSASSSSGGGSGGSSPVPPSDEKTPEGMPSTPSLPDLPAHVTYVIIGAGTAAFSAIRGIRKNDPNARVGFVANVCFCCAHESNIICSF